MKTSSASQSDSGSPAIGGVTRLTASACRHDLWLTAVEAMGKIDMGPVARRFVRAWVAMGVERMQMTDCLSPAYLAIARANLETFIHLMKTEAVIQGGMCSAQPAGGLICPSFTRKNAGCVLLPSSGQGRTSARRTPLF